MTQKVDEEVKSSEVKLLREVERMRENVRKRKARRSK